MDHQKLLRRAINLLSIRDRSIKEVKDKLSSLTNESLLVDEVIEKLLKEGLLNDQRFAKLFTESLRSRLKGPTAIKYELLRKGIQNEIINQVIKENFSDKDTEMNQIKTFLNKKSSWKNLPTMEFKKKAFAALQRRGFRFEAIRAVIDDFGSKE